MDIYIYNLKNGVFTKRIVGVKRETPKRFYFNDDHNEHGVYQSYVEKDIVDVGKIVQFGLSYYSFAFITTVPSDKLAIKLFKESNEKQITIEQNSYEKIMGELMKKRSYLESLEMEYEDEESNRTPE